MQEDAEAALRAIGATEVSVRMSANVVAGAGLRHNTMLPGVRNTIAIASGKGGVGKSSVAVNLAVALAQEGSRVGLIDADIYGPSAPLMFGLDGQRPRLYENEKGERKFEPLVAYGVKVMSIGFLIDPDQAVIWRGPMASGALKQFITDVDWGELDYLIFDMPPGTGDIQLTLTQRVPVSGAVIVTTPQEIALLDARKGLQLFRKVGVPVLGIVENMGLHRCPACGHESHVFDAGGGRELAARYGTTLLGELPLDGAIRERADSGRPTVVSDPDSPVARTYHEIARRAAGALAASAIRGAVKMPEIRIEGE
jgi:ATP-binding protein involved in chromosome partitioning